MHVGLDTPLYENPDVYRRRWALLGVLCLSLVLVVMAVSGLNVATPSLQQDLDATSTQLHWIIDAYAIVFAGLLLPAGALGDRYGRKGALLVGLAIFGLGLAVAAIAGDATQVIVGRGVMGVGAAFVMPATLSLISAIFPPQERTKAIATWAGFAGAGGSIGPIMSGLLLEKFWWGSTMLALLPVVALTAAAVFLWAPRSRDSQSTPLDPTGAVLSLVGMLSLLYGIIEAGERGWTDSLVLASFGGAVVLLGGFLFWQSRARHPMLPLSFFRNPSFSVGSLVVTVSFFAMFGFFFLSTLYLQYVLDYSPLDTGLASLPLAAAFILVSPRSATLSERYGAGPIMASGFLLIAAGMGIFSQVGGHTSYPLLGLAFFVMGSGMGVVAAPATGAIMSAVPLDKAGVGSAVNDTTRELGGALGIAVLGTMVSSTYGSNIDLAGTGLSAGDRAAAEESIGGAVHVVHGLGANGAQVLTRAQEAFVDAFQFTNLVLVGVAVAGAAMVLATLGRRRGAEAPATDLALEAVPDEVELAPVEA
jgi:MFS transporter, DHA2 family, integral membrane protein